MTFEELLKQIKKLPIAELRFDFPSSIEAVVRSNVTEQLQQLLNSFFGQPIKPADKAVPRELAERLEEFGGLRANQTAYCVERDGFFYYAMLWPWSDRTFITVKIEQCQPKKK